MYKLEGDSDKTSWLKENLQLSPTSSIAIDTLKERLKSLSNDSNPIVTKLNSLGVSTLGTQKTLTPAVLGRWIVIKEKFSDFVKQFEKAVPEGRAAHVSLVLPSEVESVIGPLQHSWGNTSSALFDHRGSIVNQNTLSNIGSSSKVMTGLFAAIMENQGVLRLSDSINRFFPREVMANFQNHLSTDETVKIDPAHITVEALASMTAGLPYEQDCGVKRNEIDPSSTPVDEILRDHFVRGSIPFIARPGDRMNSYSNQIFLTGYVVEKAFKEKCVRELVQVSEGLGGDYSPA